MNWSFTLAEWVKHRALSSALVAAAALIGIQLWTGPYADLILDLCLWGLIAWVGRRKAKP